ncbi:MAG: DNA-processing protein DprA, partial [Burkholderiaceae bacterium]
MDRSELAHWLRLTVTPGIGNSTGRSLLARFGLPEQIFAQSTATLRAVVNPTQAQALAQLPDGFDTQLQRTWDWLHPVQASAESEGARAVITLADACYPPALLAMEDPPPLLYVQGAARWLAPPRTPVAALGLARCIAIVGSRNPTPQGTDNARRFASALVQAGYTVVSGLARGVDGAAHLGALDAVSVGSDHPATVAVVGTGLDRVYPTSHLALARRITSLALMVSEYPIGTPPIAA